MEEKKTLCRLLHSKKNLKIILIYMKKKSTVTQVYVHDYTNTSSRKCTEMGDVYSAQQTTSTKQVRTTDHNPELLLLLNSSS